MGTAARLVSVIAIVLWLCASVLAQQTVYKWVDREGNVHFSDEPPPPSETVSIEEMTLSKTSPRAQTSMPPPRRETEMAKEDIESAAAPSMTTIPQSADIDLDSLSQEELDRRCEAEREAKISPLREIEIEKCINEQRKDPDYCRRFFADYGAGGRTIHGTYRPRMFHDLPVCLEAEKRRHGGRSRVE